MQNFGIMCYKGYVSWTPLLLASHRIPLPLQVKLVELYGELIALKETYTNLQWSVGLGKRFERMRTTIKLVNEIRKIAVEKAAKGSLEYDHRRETHNTIIKSCVTASAFQMVVSRSHQFIFRPELAREPKICWAHVGKTLFDGHPYIIFWGVSGGSESELYYRIAV